ncbi:MAG: DUF885 domain-containing protein [Acidimicrobiia bacterium]|nr:DUF885 domain-containing protein [Acidimicrobiia bacterium]
MSEAGRIADEYSAYRDRTDHLAALWMGDVDQLDGWEDHSPAGSDRHRHELLAFAGRAEAIEANPIGRDQALLETIAFTAGSLATQLEWRDEFELPNPEVGIHSLILTFLPRYPLRSTEHGRAYLGKIATLGQMFDGLNARLRESADRGRVPIRPLIATTIDRLDRHLAANRDPLAGQPAPSENPDPDWARKLKAALEEHARPALESFRETLATHSLPAAPPEDKAGICHLPGGEDGYRRLIGAHTSLDLDAQTVHRIGLEQVERLEDEYLRLAGPLLGTRSIAEIYAGLRNDPQLHYASAEDLVADARVALARAVDAMGGWFASVPEARCEAEAIDQGALAFYSRPSASVGKPGIFYFNTSDPTMWGTFQLEAVTFHEGVPGHHLQLALALELAGLHPVHSKLYIAAFNEGWGLYSERLADEMGLYTSDLARVGMLSADSMRACRLVVDTGIHGLGWSRTEAVQYMKDHSPMTHRQVTGEIDRYIGDPGQALGYMIGRLEIDGIRAEAEAELGGSFDIRAFHECVLGNGTVPLPTLKRMVTEWVSATRG